jgi:hypothetical protein
LQTDKTRKEPLQNIVKILNTKKGKNIEICKTKAPRITAHLIESLKVRET